MGTWSAYPGSVVGLVVTVGDWVPNQLALKFLAFAGGAGIEPPLWRSTMPPYQLPLMSLFEKSEFAADWTGELVPPLPSRKRTPAVQLLMMRFCVTEVLSVWFLKIMPVRLSSITLLWPELPLLLLMSTPERLPKKRELRASTAAVWPCTARPTELRVGSFQSVMLLPSRVMPKPSTTTPVVETRTVAVSPPFAPLMIVLAELAPWRVSDLPMSTSS